MREDLRDRTKRYALRIIRMFGALPKDTVAQIIGKQVLRSGTSVGANFREACRARSDNEFIAKLGICLQELEDTIYWLELLLEANILTENQLSELLDESNQLMAIFTTISKNQKNKANN